MKPNSRSFPFAGGLILIAAFTGPVAARGQDVPIQLAPVVVAATRVPESSATVGSDVAVVTGGDLAREQLTTLQDALGVIPSAPVFASGQAGGAASIFMRGANSDQTLFLVDGIRLNDANTDYAVFLGGARMFPGDKLDVAFGPQSTLYGSDAAGGVVSLTLQKGSGPMSGDIAVEAGSFDTFSETASIQGASGKWAYDGGFATASTDNSRVNNAFDSTNFAARIDYAAGRFVDLGATLRAFRSHYGDPGDSFTNDTVSHETEENTLATLFADARLTQYVDSRLTLGLQDRHYNALIDASAYNPLETQITNTGRFVADWQNVFQMTQSNRLVAGLTEEGDSNLNTGFGNIDRHEDDFALFGEDEWNPLKGVYLTGGLRRDDYDTFGAATTGRATAALLMANNALKLRGSYGTGFNAPSFLDLYGVDVGYQGNSKLVPERSQGWDMGFDFYSPGNLGTVSFTWFRTDYENLITDNFNVYPATTVNLGSARTQGQEISVKTTLAAIIQTKVSYTRLEADDVTDGTPLERRPRYQADADLWADLGRGFSIGGGAGWTGARADVDPQTYLTIYDPTYAVARVYAAWKINRHLTVKVRVENALDKAYQPVAGYPALGRGIFGGAYWAF